MKLSSPLLILSVIAVCMCGCGRRASRQSFDKTEWNRGRKENPDLNNCPAMLDDLMTKHLALGMSLSEITNLLGDAEIKTPMTNGTHIRGEFIEQTVYVYEPGIHNGWLVEGTNFLVLLFGRNNEYLREWSPVSVTIRRPSNTNSDAILATAPAGGLSLGNLQYSSTPSQFDALLGHPNEKRIEHQLNYSLGKRSRFAWDTIFLELHFDQNERLSQMSSSEH